MEGVFSIESSDAFIHFLLAILRSVTFFYCPENSNRMNYNIWMRG